ncbi:low molecular weight phosphatase family protein [Sinomonas sp. ASV322]|uniref:arsenate reductase/protein-tyrosine-phosphatase family protein n=1 Tax=Sinomonas sp. ASV322 TaxID=3041920 RepID=UPI0027DD8C1C|nr:low molecular weight phosphatase family protein [Sinomonas sp. ASV322]MDQ4502975.1 low molecular weight phosphatase family protein [Sinomonas sp. ASV322]
MSADNFHVLFVCSGNICRSPMAEQLLRARGAGSDIGVSSAGTIADEGAPMTREAAELSQRYGGDPSGHRSRLLTSEVLMSADLVLTATRAQRASVAQLVPRASRRTFTIREFSRLLRAIPGDDRISLRDSFALVEAARSRRGFIEPPNNPDDDDVEDPYLRPIEVYERVAALLDSEVKAIAAHLALGGGVR